MIDGTAEKRHGFVGGFSSVVLSLSWSMGLHSPTGHKYEVSSNQSEKVILC